MFGKNWQKVPVRSRTHAVLFRLYRFRYQLVVHLISWSQLVHQPAESATIDLLQSLSRAAAAEAAAAPASLPASAALAETLSLLLINRHVVCCTLYNRNSGSRNSKEQTLADTLSCGATSRDHHHHYHHHQQQQQCYQSCLITITLTRRHSWICAF